VLRFCFKVAVKETKASISLISSAVHLGKDGLAMAMNYLNLVSLLDGFNWLFDFHTGGGKRPVFFDVDQVYPSLRALDRNFPSVREELLGLLAEKATIPRYHDLDRMQTYISNTVDTDKDWKIFYLYAMGEKPAANRARCPKTADLLDSIPGLFQAFFSILDGGKSVPAHRGPYRGYIRYHLALVVPHENPPSIRIKDQHYTWKEGESILFDDSWDHEVYNKSDGDRVVLIVDVRRPMPLPFAAINRLVESAMRLIYGKQVVKKLA
jgi:aspartyl/asparaginyl beta-hydroxylase (cupin superfamily)